MQTLKCRRTARVLSWAASFLGLALLLLGHALQADAGQRANFDHAITGFPLSGAHQRTSCESCHVNGIFKGTPVQCIFCHQGGSKTSSTSKPPNHVPSASPCDSCHRGTAAWSGAYYDHAGAAGCAGCHSGSYLGASGKPPNHVPSSSTCESCHRGTAAWGGARYDHAGIATGCAGCHSGTYLGVPGPPASHIPGRQTNCEGCHKSTSIWLSF